ncbi:MAG: hypothetical protein A2Z49_04385 [Chloroflexi bacterium RBG_19FT_COMBO_56_12]|nr:MAG: hypothetical protein A2Z49_04385 [Chloroflexi bacterium RBG_19FT_COMBO_56_12]
MKRQKTTRAIPRVLKPEDILVDHSPEVRSLVEQLRRLIRETVPEATELAYPVWHAIGYRHPHSGYFCGIFPHADRVDLAFEFGVLLPDLQGILDGDGKQVRYVRIREPGDIRSEAIQNLIRATLSLPEGRTAKLWLVKSSAKVAWFDSFPPAGEPLR